MSEPTTNFTPSGEELTMPRNEEQVIKQPREGTSHASPGSLPIEAENVAGCEMMAGKFVCLHRAPLMAEPCLKCPRRGAHEAAKIIIAGFAANGHRNPEWIAEAERIILREVLGVNSEL